MSDVISTVVVFLAAVVVAMILFAFPTMWCWNYLMPDLFNLPTIGFTQAAVMNILTSLLFKPSIQYKKD